MSNIRYKDELYDTRAVADLRELMNSGAELYGDRAAYLVKDRLGGRFVSVSFRRFRADVTALGAALVDAGYLSVRNSGGDGREREGVAEQSGRAHGFAQSGRARGFEQSGSANGFAQSGRANGFAQSGSAHGRAPSRSKIAIISENCYEYVVAYFAVVCGGGVAVPIDPRLSTADVSGLLRRSAAVAVFHSKKYEIAESAECTRIPMDDVPRLIAAGENLIERGDDRFLRVRIEPGELCALLFTSGTTGASKGVMLSHANLVSNVRGMSAFINASGMISLSVLPMHHALEFTCDILTALYQGCTVAICEGLRHIKRDLVESGAQVVIGVPLVFEKMHRNIMKTAERAGRYEALRGMINFAKLAGGGALTKPLFRAVRRSLGGKVKLFLVGGAPCDPAVVSDFNAMGIRMIQGYGMTETSPIISVGKDRCGKDASVGIPLCGSFVQIDDADVNGVGEIVVAGPSVMLGYYDDESATKAAMPDGRLRTGDLGRFDDDGFLYITGRVKNVVVLKNGKNVYPEEVECRLRKSRYIEEAVVSGEPGRNTKKAASFASLGEDRKDDPVVSAEIFPDMDAIKRDFGDASADDMRKILDREIDKANASLPLHSRVARVALRDTPFDKTTTKKIRRASER
ncbi:MAG: AMP-binding protein [Clostridiales Family XIII bacterium]|nr:AMP-binding protein [Clostridiales Family XIII bacterium]